MKWSEKVTKKKIQEIVNFESCRPHRTNAEVQDDEGTKERGGTGSGAEVWRSEKDMKQSTKNATHVIPKARDKMLLRAILRGGVWNGFLLGRAKKEDVPCQFCGKKGGDGRLFWECSFPPLLHVREPLWRGWKPGL